MSKEHQGPMRAGNGTSHLFPACVVVLIWGGGWCRQEPQERYLLKAADTSFLYNLHLLPRLRIHDPTVHSPGQPRLVAGVLLPGEIS